MGLGLPEVETTATQLAEKTGQQAAKVWGAFFAAAKAHLKTFTNYLERRSAEILREGGNYVMEQVELFLKREGQEIESIDRIADAIEFEEGSAQIHEWSTRKSFYGALKELMGHKFEQLTAMWKAIQKARGGKADLYGHMGTTESGEGTVYIKLKDPGLNFGDYPLFEALAEGRVKLSDVLKEVFALPPSGGGKKK
jgi:hypothetical protein